MMILVLENKFKMVVPLFGAAYAAPNKSTINYTDLDLHQLLLNPTINGTIQGLFKAFE